jgi:L-iditol 2-dehydrogenase
MKVAVYYSNNDIRLEERPVPSLSEEEILVEMKVSGICGTDVMEWYRIKKAPRVLGHEVAGEIAEVGNKVAKFNKGDRVFVSHHVPCFKCHYCLHGNYTACETLHTGNYEPGGFSEFIRIPEDNVKRGTFLLPDTITYEEAAMIEPLACAVAGQNRLNLKKGQTVLVIGSGVSGILHIQMAKNKGVKVIAADIDEYRMKKAAEFGADHVVDAGQYSLEKLRALNDNRPADAVIVCAAAIEAIENALFSVDRNGNILFFAVPQDNISIPSLRFWRDEITVTFSYGAAPDDLRKAVELINSRSIDVGKMITHRVPFSDIAEGFQLVTEAKESLKVVVVPDKSTPPVP